MIHTKYLRYLVLVANEEFFPLQRQVCQIRKSDHTCAKKTNYRRENERTKGRGMKEKREIRGTKGVQVMRITAKNKGIREKQVRETEQRKKVVNRK